MCQKKCNVSKKEVCPFVLLLKASVAAAAIYGVYAASKACMENREALCQRCGKLMHHRTEKTEASDFAD